MARKPRLAVVKFASCDGCQLTLLDCEDELLAVADAVHFAHFAEASSHLEEGPYDLALVEGSITTPHDAERIIALRRQSRVLVTIGACATAGGIQALRNFADHPQMLQAVYARPDYIASLATSTPIRDHVQVDYELRGCPIDKHELLELITAVLAGRLPRPRTESVCAACKRRGTVCVLVAKGTPCLGPVTQTGCGAICPAYDRGCYGCFGPSAQPNLPSLSDQLLRSGLPPLDVVHLLRSFNGYAPAFCAESQRLLRLFPAQGTASAGEPCAPPTQARP
jgi:coenzyme F420-reducing hydrogenase gamma subunit